MRILEGTSSNQISLDSAAGGCGLGLAEEAGHLADLFAFPTAHHTPQFDIITLNEVQRAVLIFLSHGSLGSKT